MLIPQLFLSWVKLFGRNQLVTSWTFKSILIDSWKKYWWLSKFKIEFISMNTFRIKVSNRWYVDSMTLFIQPTHSAAPVLLENLKCKVLCQYSANIDQIYYILLLKRNVHHGEYHVSIWFKSVGKTRWVKFCGNSIQESYEIRYIKQ